MNNLKILNRVILILIIIGITGRLFAQNCDDLTKNSVTINTLCTSLQNTLITGDATLSVRDQIKLQPGFNITGTNLNGHKFTAKIDHTLANQTNDYESTSVNGTVPSLDKNNYIPGTIGETVDVSPSGAAIYQVPIQVSPGSKGLQPSISISYSSQGGNGVLGWGWNIGGISAITRVNKSIYYDDSIKAVSMKDYDAFALDGTRLIKDSDGSYYLANNPYVRITYNSSSNYFTVINQDGTVMEFGKDDGTKVTLSGHDSPYKWCINRTTDTDGNYIKYIYTGNGSTDEHRISEIKYTGNSVNNREPYNSIKFYYDQRIDVNNTYLAEGNVSQNTLLASIKVFCEGSLSKDYEFSYFADGYSKLHSISLTADGVKYNPTYIKWGESIVNNDITKNVSNSDELYSTQYYYGDYNGDGILDKAKWNGAPSINFQITGASSSYTVDLPSDRTYSDYGWNFKEVYTYKDIKVVDANNDGKDELIILYSLLKTEYQGATMNRGESYFSGFDYEKECSFNGTEFVGRIKSSEETLERNIEGRMLGLGYNYYYADLNNDGNTDKLVFRAGALQRCEGINLPSIPTIQGISNVKFIDFNGNGRTDFLAITATGKGSIWEFNGSTFVNIFATTEDFFFGKNPNSFFPGDFNGDGKTDFIGKNLNSWFIRYSTGKSFVDGTLPSEINVVENDQLVDPGAYADPSLNYNLPEERRNLFTLEVNLSPALSVSTEDLNNDGKSDIIWTRSGIVYVYLSKGASVFSSIASISMLKTGNNFFDPHSNVFLMAADFNNDGQKEILYGDNDYYYTNGSLIADNETSGYTLKHENYKTISFNNSLDRNLYVNSITDGLGTKSTFDYTIFNDNRPFSASFPRPTFPLMLVRGPLKVVSKLIKTGVVSDTTTYSRSNGYTHLNGLGFICYKDITENNLLTKVSTTTNYEFTIPEIADRYLVWIKSENKVRGTAEISQQTNTIKGLRANTSMKYFIPVIDNSIYIDKINNVTTTTTKLYNSTLGRLASEYSTIGSDWQTNKTFNYVAVANKTSKLMSEVIFTTMANSPESFTNTVEYTYDTSFPFRIASTKVQGITTSNTQWDAYGNTLSSTKLGRTVSRIYDTKGRFIVSNTDFTQLTTKRSYRSSNGAILSETDARGLTTRYSYTVGNGNFITQQTLPDGRYNKSTIAWDNTGNGLYYKQNEIQYGATSTTYYNCYGNKTYELSNAGFNGANHSTRYVYNSLGQLTQEIKSGIDTPDTYSYDNLGRITSKNGHNGLQITYIYGAKTLTSQSTKTGTEVRNFDDAGNVIQVSSANGNVSYKYNSMGKIDRIIAECDTTKMTYDNRGNQLSLKSSDAGLTTYTYNNFDELTDQIDAKFQTVNITYENGRVKTKTGAGISETYNYYPNGMLQNVSRDNVKESYIYDELIRPKEVKIEGAGKTFTTNYQYNSKSQIEYITYPSGLKVKYLYDNVGNLQKIYNNDDLANPIWNGVSRSPLEQWTEFTYGNGLTTKYGYSATTYMLSSIQSGTQASPGSVLNMAFSFNSKGQLDSMSQGASRYEVFRYDAFNRLIYSKVNGQNAQEINYANNGNITSTTIGGNYTYGINGKPHLASIVSGTSTQFPSFAANCDYTGDNKVAKVYNPTNSSEFTYAPSGNRYKVDNYANSTLISSKIFVDNNEFLLNSSGTITTKRTFIYAPSGICAVYQDSLNVKSIYYVHADYLGSWLKITNASGQVKNSYSYDAWGRPRNPNTWAVITLSTTNMQANLSAMQPRFDRGYTGHEHLCGFGLINMNGRFYDPYLQRFLSPDMIVQSQFNAQNYNRFSYCFNNPMMFTDPTGWKTETHLRDTYMLPERSSANNNMWVNLPSLPNPEENNNKSKKDKPKDSDSNSNVKSEQSKEVDVKQGAKKEDKPKPQGDDPNSYALFSNKKDAEKYVNRNAKKDGKEMFWYILDDGKVIVGPWNDALPDKTSPRYAEQFFMGGKIKYEDNYYQANYFVHLHFKGPTPTPGVDNLINNYFWRNGHIPSLIYWNGNYYYHQNGNDIIIKP